MSEPLVLKALKDGILSLTLNRPQALNALSLDLLKALNQAIDEIVFPEIRVVILKGAGRAFAAGADIRELQLLSPIEAQAHAKLGQQIFQKIENHPVPFIAAIHGYALGGGCELALACTFRLAAEHSILGQPEVHLGLIPGFGGTQRLPHLIGWQRALDWILTGRHVPASEALEQGLLLKVVPQEALEGEALNLAHQLLKVAPRAEAMAKQVMFRTRSMDFEAETQLFALAISSKDAQEGLRAFLEKRPPLFRGE